MSFVERIENEAKNLESDVEGLIHPENPPVETAVDPVEPAPVEPAVEPAPVETKPVPQIVRDVEAILAKLEDYKTSHPNFAEFDRAIELVKVVVDVLARVTEIL